MSRRRVWGRALSLAAAAGLLAACASMLGRDQISSEDRSRRLAEFRLLKKYDLAEAHLKEDLAGYEKAGDRLGQLWSSLDLAEVYTSGLINFRLALGYYDRAAGLNEQVRGEASAPAPPGEKPPPGRERKFYRLQGGLVSERTYDYRAVAAEIDTRRRSLLQLLGEATGPPDPGAGTGVEPAAPEARADPAFVRQFVERNERSVREELRRRYKLSADAREFLASFTTAQIVMRSFPVTALPREQVEAVVRYADQGLASRDEAATLSRRAYLTFVRVVGLSQLGAHAEAIQAFGALQEHVQQLDREAREQLARLKAAREKDLSRAALVTAIGLAIDIASIVASASTPGGGTQTEFSKITVPALLGSLQYHDRQIQMVGESEYAKQFNSVLNMDEQLLLWDAVGRAYHETRELRQSARYNREAIEIVNQLRATAATERHRIGFARQKDVVFNRLVDALVGLGDEADGFAVSENARSRAFVDLLGSRRDVRFKDRQSEEYVRQAREIQLYVEMIRQQTSISDEQAAYVNNSLRLLRPEDGAAPRAVTVGAPVATGEGSRGGPVSRPAAPSSPSSAPVPPAGPSRQELESLASVSTSSLKDVQAFLPPDVALLEFYVSDAATYAWIVDRARFRARTLAISRGDLEEAVSQFHDALYRDVLGASGARTVDRLARALYDRLFAELEPLLAHRRVYVVGHRFLHFLPLEALHDGTDYLVTRFAFAYLPSATVLPLLKDKNRALGSILALGNPAIGSEEGLSPLPGAEQEVERVAAGFARRSVLIGSQATETAFRRRAAEFDVVHLASHGVLDARRPLASRLFLAGDGEHDGRLFAAELYGIPLNASLVTLSACETGLSVIESGDELLGLLRGFFFAGTRSVVASLWKVDDRATTELMSAFYGHLRRMDRSEALRLAKVELARTPAFAHPFYWSAFTLFGSAD